jgi:hypothetical protein
MTVVVKEHYGLFGAFADIVDIAADILIVEGISVIDETVDAVGEDEVENGLFRVLVDGMYRKIMERSYYRDIAAALEGLSDYSAQYLALEINMTVSDYHTYQQSSAHSLTPFAKL